MTVWPSYAETIADPEYSEASDVLRSQFDDGAVRQARAFTSRTMRRRIGARIPSGRGADWLAWVGAHAHAYFAWTDPIDGLVYNVRVVGGAAGVRTSAGRAGSGRAPHWIARLELEGSAAPV